MDRSRTSRIFGAVPGGVPACDRDEPVFRVDSLEASACKHSTQNDAASDGRLATIQLPEASISYEERLSRHCCIILSHCGLTAPDLSVATCFVQLRNVVPAAVCRGCDLHQCILLELGHILHPGLRVYNVGPVAQVSGPGQNSLKTIEECTSRSHPDTLNRRIPTAVSQP